VGVIVGLLWLVAAGSEQDGGPSTGLFYVFGIWYIIMRVCWRQRAAGSTI
jgi:hypothetical protein